jgi:hypothetical protein
MLYWKFSSNRVFFLNEYWIFIPSAILANYVIIRKIRLDREREKQLKKLIGCQKFRDLCTADPSSPLC